MLTQVGDFASETIFRRFILAQVNPIHLLLVCFVSVVMARCNFHLFLDKYLLNRRYSFIFSELLRDFSGHVHRYLVRTVSSGSRIRLFRLFAISKYFVDVGLFALLFFFPFGLVSAGLIGISTRVRYRILHSFISILGFTAGIQGDF